MGTNTLEGGMSFVYISPDRTSITKVPKQFASPPHNAMSTVKRAAGRWLTHRIQLHSHVNQDVRSAPPQLEVEVLTTWNANDVPSPHILSVNNDEVKYEFFEADPYDVLLRKPDHQEIAFAALIDTYQRIRRVGEQTQDYKNLHTDPHLGNFLWHAPVAIAIDPHPTRITAGMPYRTVDTLLNLELMREVYDIGGAHRDAYLQQYADAFTRTERKEMAEMHTVQPYLRLVFGAFALASRLVNHEPNPTTRKRIDPEKISAINAILKGTASGN